MSHNTGCDQFTENTTGNRRIAPGVSNLLTVLVVARDGQALNPCHPARARELIRKQRAVRICRHPYTIRLLTSGRMDVDAITPQQEPL
jgi:hypothetical protein